ncbi:MAG: hypothetical protein WC765_09100 [Phycisphaerae bacterium]|jgi:hypothetical protein
MRIINITPLLMEAKQAILADLLVLKNECGVTDVAFMLPLHPEQPPLSAKIEHLGGCFSEMRKELENSGLRVGILVQSLMSHGDRGGALVNADMNQIVSLDGKQLQRLCPLGQAFREYSHQAMTTLALTKPDFFLIDDDFRLFLEGIGCFCELHLDAFFKASGKALSREQLVGILQRDDPVSRDIGRLWNDVSRSSMLSMAKCVRDGINVVDSKIPCGFFTSSNGEFAWASDIANILAGETPPLVRLNNSHYHEDGYKIFPRRMYNTAMESAYLPNVAEVLVEADTFPQNRFSQSARSLNAQIVGTLLNGVNGVLLWITALTEFKPEAGVAYRDMLRRHQGYYGALSLMLPEVEWRGPSTPFPIKPASFWNPIELGKQVYTSNWAGNILGRLGIPAQFGGTSKIKMLAGREVDFFSDEELLGFFAGGLLLDGAAAEKICDRGFSNYLGVGVKASQLRVSLDRLSEDANLNGKAAGAKFALMNFACATRAITVMHESVTILSELMLEPWYQCPVPQSVGPGLTLFTNHIGGRIAVYAMSLCGDEWNDGYNFINLKRKEQLVRVMELLGDSPLPFMVLGDVDLYVKHGDIRSNNGGGQLLCVFNLNSDTLPELRLRVADPNVSEIFLLSEMGEWRKPLWKSDGGSEIIVKTEVETMKPLILKVMRVR